MTTWIKEGVLGDLNPEIRRAKGKVVRLYANYGLDFFITSKRDGNHSTGSCHPEGDAIDFKYDIKVSIQMIKDEVGSDFDVIFEYDHIHMEYDPK